MTSVSHTPHSLVHATAAKEGADRSLEVVEEGMHLLRWVCPVEVAVLVGDVAVE
jgi:hypothetical protein